MIDRDHDLSLVRHAELLRLSRGSLYYHPRVVPTGDLAIMRRIDELHLDYPFAGSRMLRDLLRGEGVAIGRERVASMMRRMGIEALYRRPHTSKPADGHKIYPYLLRGLAVERANQVWAMDIPTFQWHAALSTWLPWWTGSVGGFSPGGCPSRWRSRKAVPVQNSSNQIVAGDQHKLADGCNGVGRGAVALAFAPPRQTNLGVDTAHPVNGEHDLGGFSIDVGNHLMDHSTDGTLLQPRVGCRGAPDGPEITGQIGE